MPEPNVIPPGGGEVIGDSPDRRVEIVAAHDALHATVSRFGPGREGADLHVHRRHTDLFYVLAGELTVRLGAEDRQVPVSEGTVARVPPLVVHGFRNASEGELRYLNLHAPGEGFADYLRALRDGRTLVYDQENPPADSGRPASGAVIGGEEEPPAPEGPGEALLTDVEAIAIAEARLAPGAVPPQHVHRRHVESLYVLEGELALAYGERALSAGAGAWVEVPAGVPHAVSAAGADPVRVLELHTPSCGFGAFLRALRDTGGDEASVAAHAGFDLEPAGGG